jgi:peroxiredoxin
MKLILTAIIVFFTGGILNAQQNPEGLLINSKAYDFKGKDQNGEEIRLKELLKKGKVVLVFYRGNWCPYCNRELKKLEDSLQFILDKGAQVVAVTPEKPEGISKTIEKTKASYPILWDEDLKIMKAYDVAYEIPENTLNRYRSTGINIEENNGKSGKYLPVPAIYIISQSMDVVYRFFETDYKKRPSVAEILKNL